MIEKNKEIFYQRVESLINHLERAQTKRKKIMDESKMQDKKQENRRPLRESNTKDMRSLKTEDMTAMPVQRANTTLFSSIPLDKKNKISSFEMISWTDPNNPNP